MTQRLQWRDAERSDRQALQQFSCAPARRKDLRGRPFPHPVPWAREVELGVRTLTPPARDGLLLLGEDEPGRLRAVVLLYDGAKEDDVFTMKLVAVAVAIGAHRRGYGAEAMEQALQAAESRAYGLGCTAVEVFGLVHKLNAPSRALCTAIGFICLGQLSSDDAYEEWAIGRALPPD